MRRSKMGQIRVDHDKTKEKEKEKLVEKQPEPPKKEKVVPKKGILN